MLAADTGQQGWRSTAKINAIDKLGRHVPLDFRSLSFSLQQLSSYFILVNAYRQQMYKRKQYKISVKCYSNAFQHLGHLSLNSAYEIAKCTRNCPGSGRIINQSRLLGAGGKKKTLTRQRSPMIGGLINYNGLCEFWSEMWFPVFLCMFLSVCLKLLYLATFRFQSDVTLPERTACTKSKISSSVRCTWRWIFPNCVCATFLTWRWEIHIRAVSNLLSLLSLLCVRDRKYKI